MPGSVPLRYLDQSKVRSKKMDVWLDEKDLNQLTELTEWFGCSRSEAVRTAVRHAFAVRGSYGRQA